MTAPLKTALIYDFDGTLARGNMQEVSFIPSVGMEKSDFWAEAGAASTPARACAGVAPRPMTRAVAAAVARRRSFIGGFP